MAVALGFTITSVDTPGAYFYCSGMPAFASLPTGLRIAGVLGYLEALAVISYGISIRAFETTGSTSGISGSGADLAPSVLTVLYAAFATLMGILATVLVRRRRAGLTPFLLVQAFALVVAQPLLLGNATRVLGVVVAVVALIAAGSALAPASRESLR